MAGENNPPGGSTSGQTPMKGESAGAPARPALGGYGPGGAPSARFIKPMARPTMHPRRVVGGIRMSAKPPSVVPGEPGPEAPAAGTTPAGAWSWAAARWIRTVEERASGEQLAEGLEYARAGQTRSIEFRAGIVTARVQGRMPQAYKTSVRVPVFSPEQWDQVTGVLASQPKYAASLLSGEMPANIEDIFAPLNLSLFPADASALGTSCDCDVFTGRVREFVALAPPVEGVAPTEPTVKIRPGGGTPYCKHVCCVMYLIADRLCQSALAVFSLRGLPEADLLERLRQARALQGLQRSGGSAMPVYVPHVPAVPGCEALEGVVESFWEPGAGIGMELAENETALDLPIALPEVSHPLLRRVGPSPFVGAKFPLVGLLATCYDVISGAAIRGELGGTAGESSATAE